MWPHQQQHQQQQQHQYSGIPSLTEQQIDTRQYHQGIMPPDIAGQSLTMHQHQREQPARESAICSSNARASRNLAEKQRRDNLNTNISLMAAMVPIVAGSSRKQDKISILRLAGAFVRTDYTIGQGTPGFLPDQFNGIDFEKIFLDSYDGTGAFLLVVTTIGSIVHISKSVEGSLGHAPNELLGKSLFTYTHPEDHDDLARNLTPESNNLAITSSADQSPSSSDSVIISDTRNFREQRRNFQLKIAQRTNARGEHTQYKCFELNGVLRLADFCRNERGGNREHTTTSNDIIFVGIARLMQRRLTELSLFEATKQEYVTRHLIDGRIIFCDHRISVVAGYMSEEVSGANAFRFMHADDVRWTMIGLRQMYDRREGYGSSCYRLLSKTGEFIYLRTHGYLEMDTATGTFESFVCVNTLVDEEEGEKLIREMKDRYSATITNASRAIIEPEHANMHSSSEPRVEDATQLEEVIEKLLKDLSSPGPPPEDGLSTPPAPDIQYAKAAMYSQKLPPASVQANKLGVIPPDHSNKGKSKYLKRELKSIASPASSIEDGDETHRHRVVNSPRRQVAVSYRRPDKIIPQIASPRRTDEICHKPIQQPTPPPPAPAPAPQRTAVPQSSGRCKEIYESKSNEPSSQVTIDEDITQNSSPTSSPAHRGKPDSMMMFLKTETIEDMLDEPSCKRRFQECDPVLPDKRQCPGDFYSNGSPSDEATLEDIMKSNPEILKMLDEIVPPMDFNPEDVADADLLQFVPEQVDETLRQTYAQLEDQINYQGSQINELGMVFENPNLQAQRENLNELQAEHEIQKELMKNLRQDHNNMKVKVKQNAGV